MINSIVGVDTTLKGKFEINGVLRIDGKFYGEVTGETDILVGSTGSAFCTIQANNIVIGGYVEGNLFICDKVTILSGGLFKGNIASKTIEINPGAQFQGKHTKIEQY